MAEDPIEPNGDGEALMTVPRVAGLLDVPVSWVYASVANGRLPHYRVGRYIRFRRGEVEDWLACQRATRQLKQQ